MSTNIEYSTDSEGYAQAFVTTDSLRLRVFVLVEDGVSVRFYSPCCHAEITYTIGMMPDEKFTPDTRFHHMTCCATCRRPTGIMATPELWRENASRDSLPRRLHTYLEAWTWVGPLELEIEAHRVADLVWEVAEEVRRMDQCHG